MLKLNPPALAFVAGLCVALLAVFSLGASKPAKSEAKMSIEVVPVMGGIGGILMTVTNHTENKAYMYIMKSDKDKDKDKEKDKDEDKNSGDIESLPELVGTIDLSSAGNEKLSAEIKKQ